MGLGRRSWLSIQKGRIMGNTTPLLSIPGPVEPSGEVPNYRTTVVKCIKDITPISYKRNTCRELDSDSENLSASQNIRHGCCFVGLD